MPPRIPQAQAQVMCLRRTTCRIGILALPCSRTLIISPTPAPLNQPPPPSTTTAAATHQLHTSATNLKRFYVPDVSRQPWILNRIAQNKEERDAFREARRLEREANASHHVWGKETEFIQKLDRTPATLPSLDSLVPETPNEDERNILLTEVVRAEQVGRLNHDMDRMSLRHSIETARLQSYPPLSTTKLANRIVTEKMNRDFQVYNSRATAAIHRIMSLGNGDSTDVTEANKQLCIQTFGRHVTDETLPQSNAFPSRQPKIRVGPDTGSSEVQAAILTVKIRKLAAHVEKNNKDKHNKSKLRQLCHKRQKHLRYLRRKERGGERYRNVMDMLGLDEEAIDQELFM